eukprot:358814-Chlamydomonas_euryale.AAC.8
MCLTTADGRAQRAVLLRDVKDGQGRSGRCPCLASCEDRHERAHPCPRMASWRLGRAGGATSMGRHARNWVEWLADHAPRGGIGLQRLCARLSSLFGVLVGEFWLARRG